MQRSGFLLLLVVILLAACATAPDVAPTAERPGDPANIRSFEIRGRLGLQGSGSALLNWSQADDYYRIVLQGPFGSGRVEIEGDANSAVWRDRNGGFASTDDPEIFLSEQLGWTLPIGALHYWVRGLASPDTPVERFNVEAGRLAALQQGGWLLRLDRYRDISGTLLPGRLILEQADRRLTLLISDWQLR